MRAPAAGAPRLRPRISTASLTSSDPGWPTLEGYDIQEVLGSGGMGTVYRAHDRERGRPVALKVMNRAGAASVLRFKHEFRTLLGVAHPNLVTLYELISDGQNWFLTMELLDGVNFLQYVRDEPPPAIRPDDPISTARNEASARDTEVIDETQLGESAAGSATQAQSDRVTTQSSLPSERTEESAADPPPLREGDGTRQIRTVIGRVPLTAGSPGARTNRSANSDAGPASPVTRGDSPAGRRDLVAARGGEAAPRHQTDERDRHSRRSGGAP